MKKKLTKNWGKVNPEIKAYFRGIEDGLMIARETQKDREKKKNRKPKKK